MALTLWSNFYDHILPDVNGVTSAIVDFHLRQVAIDFCEQTGIHAAEVTPINVVAGTATYTLTSPVPETEPYRVKAAWYNSRPLDIAPIDVLNGMNTYWPDQTGSESWCYTQKQPDEIMLFPEPDTSLANGLRVELILRPTQASTGLTDWVATRYMRVISAGVKARLMFMPGRPWSHPEMAPSLFAEYTAGRALAELDSNRSLTRGVLSVAMRPAARGGKY